MDGVIVGVEYAEIDDMSSYLGGTILITGGSFTEYSNYRITLQTELFYGDNGQETVQNSSISDYVVYTNAKVYPLVVVPPVED